MLSKLIKYHFMFFYLVNPPKSGGMIDMIINIADMKKIKCNELIKLFINKLLLLIEVYEPTKILCT